MTNFLQKASIFNSYFAEQYNIHDNGSSLPPLSSRTDSILCDIEISPGKIVEIILPQKLKTAGYVTATYGKWHLGARQWPNLPTNRGFDHHLGFLTGGEDHYTQKAYEAVSKGQKPVDLWQDAKPAYGRNGTYSCHLYGSEAVKLIESHDPTG